MNFVKFSMTIALLSLLSCNKNNEDPEPQNKAPGDFTVAVKVEGQTARLNWTPANDPDGDAVVYAVMLEDEEIATGLTTTEYLVSDLEYSRTYSGKVTASDEEGEIRETLFGFATEDPGPEGTVFISGKWFYSINLATGKPIDSLERRYSALAISEEVMYRTFENTIEAIALPDMSEAWSFDFIKDDDYETRLGEPVVIDDAVIFSGAVLDLTTFETTHNLYNLNKTTGNANWSKSTAAIITPAIKLNDRIITIEQGESGINATTYLAGRQMENGDLADSVLLGRRIASRSVIADESAVYALDWNGVAASFDAYASENWSTVVSDEALVSSTVLLDDRLYFHSRDGKTYGMNTSTGAVDWEMTTAPDEQYGSTLDTYGASLIVGSGSSARRIDLETKEEIWPSVYELPLEAYSEGGGALLVIDDYILYALPYSLGEGQERTALLLLDATNGETLWETIIYTTAHSITAISDGEVFYDNSSYMR